MRGMLLGGLCLFVAGCGGGGGGGSFILPFPGSYESNNVDDEAFGPGGGWGGNPNGVNRMIFTIDAGHNLSGNADSSVNPTVYTYSGTVQPGAGTIAGTISIDGAPAVPMAGDLDMVPGPNKEVHGIINYEVGGEQRRLRFVATDQ